MLIATSSMCGAADGLLDTTFGGSDGAGRVDLDFARPAGNFDSPRVVVVQRDHRIVVAGPCGAANGNTDICAGRLLPDGALDTTFSGGRVAIALDLGGDNADLVTDMAVDHAGRTLILANTSGGALFLMFLRSDGASSWSPDDEDDSGGGGNDRITDKPKTSPSGGIPLPFAVQSDTRLRSGHDKLADPGRRRVRTRKPMEPARPSRRRVTSSTA